MDLHKLVEWAEYDGLRTMVVSDRQRLMVTLPSSETMQLCAYCPCLQIWPHSLSIRLSVQLGSKQSGIRGEMKILDICVIGLVSIVFLSRFPSPLNSLKWDLISKKHLTGLSAVCDLFGLLVACDYVASRFSSAGQKYPEWITTELVCLVASGRLLGPAFRALLSRLFAKSSSRTQPVESALLPR
jgi:hypothetical protein